MSLFICKKIKLYYLKLTANLNIFFHLYLKVLNIIREPILHRQTKTRDIHPSSLTVLRKSEAPCKWVPHTATAIVGYVFSL